MIIGRTKQIKVPQRMSDIQPVIEKNIRIRNGDAGVLDTIGLMKQFVLRDAEHELICEVAERLTRKADTPLSKVYALWEFVQSNYHYRADPDDREHLTAPIHLLTECNANDQRECSHADCDDLTMLLSCLITAIGIDNAFKVIAWRDDLYVKELHYKMFSHIYNIVRVSNNAWIPIDVVMRSSGFANENQKLHTNPKGNRVLIYPVLPH